MDAAKLKAATTYNAAADHFDDEPLQFWTRIGRRTIDRLELPEGATVLDVGCGAGSSAIPAAERVGRRGQVVGVDLAERLLAIATEKALRNGLLNVRFLAKDMERLCYPDGCFDAVVAVFSIFFVADIQNNCANSGACAGQVGHWPSRPGARACSSQGRPFGGTRSGRRGPILCRA